jgi:hypothetical protein
MALRKTDGGSVESEDGRIILFSVPRFLAETGSGDGCFICGAKPGTKEFNNEHMIPDWVQRDRGLHSGNIVLPNCTGDNLICVSCSMPNMMILPNPMIESLKLSLYGRLDNFECASNKTGPAKPVAAAVLRNSRRLMQDLLSQRISRASSESPVTGDPRMSAKRVGSCKMMRSWLVGGQEPDSPCKPTWPSNVLAFTSPERRQIVEVESSTLRHKGKPSSIETATD